MKQISWVAAGALAGWGAIRLTGADRFRCLEAPAAPLLSFTPQAAVTALLGSVLLPRKGAAGLAALTAAALTTAMLPRGIGARQPPARGPALRVLTANLLAGQASERAVVRLVRRKRVDVLFLQELTGRAATRLEQAGLTHLLPHEMIDVRDGSRGSGIYARFPLRSGLSLRPTVMAQPTARLVLPAGQCVELICIHNCAPAAVAAQRRPLAGGASGPAAPRGSSALAGRRLQRHRRSCAVPPATAPRPRRRRRPDRKRPDPHLGTRGKTSAPHDRSCPRRSPVRRAGRLGPPRAGQ